MSEQEILKLVVGSGLLPIAKPAGISSKDVSRILARYLGKKLKMGHVGTLDPAASGVLPIVFGGATRLQDQLLALHKSYEFEMTFGNATDTFDSEGQVVETKPFDHVTQTDLESTCQKFVGKILQVPPLYSAVKYKGKPLYKYARAGQEAQVPLKDLEREVEIFKLEVVEFDLPRVLMRVNCAKGTYIRTLVSDIAKCLQTAATMTGLCRSSAAGVELSECVDIEQIESNPELLNEKLIRIENINLGIPKWRVQTESALNKLRNGQKIEVDFEAYHSGVSGIAPGIIDDGLSHSHVLMNSVGNAFGLGRVRQVNMGRFAINMERGFA